jgi:hypothetical protein
LLAIYKCIVYLCKIAISRQRAKSKPSRRSKMDNIPMSFPKVHTFTYCVLGSMGKWYVEIQAHTKSNADKHIAEMINHKQIDSAMFIEPVNIKEVSNG